MITLNKPNKKRQNKPFEEIAIYNAINQWYSNPSRGMDNCVFRSHLVESVGIGILNPLAQFIEDDVLTRESNQEVNKVILSLIDDACKKDLPFFYAGVALPDYYKDKEHEADMKEIASFLQSHGV